VADAWSWCSVLAHRYVMQEAEYGIMPTSFVYLAENTLANRRIGARHTPGSKLRQVGAGISSYQPQQWPGDGCPLRQVGCKGR
jgi:hypothetical protein